MCNFNQPLFILIVKGNQNQERTNTWAVRIFAWPCFYLIIHVTSLSMDTTIWSSDLLGTRATGCWTFSIFPCRPFTFDCVDQTRNKNNYYLPNRIMVWKIQHAQKLPMRAQLGFIHGFATTFSSIPHLSPIPLRWYLLFSWMPVPQDDEHFPCSHSDHSHSPV